LKSGLFLVISCSAAVILSVSTDFHYKKTSLFLPDTSAPEIIDPEDNTSVFNEVSKFVETNPFDSKRGVIEELPPSSDNEEIIQQVVEPEHPYNFTLRGLMTIKQEQAVILYYSSEKSKTPPVSAPGRRPSTSRGPQVNDQIFKLEEDVGETGYSVAEISSEEVILVNSSGNEIVLILDESNSISSGMREAAQKYVEKENKIIAAQQRSKEVKVPPKITENKKSNDNNSKKSDDSEKSREDKWREMRMERIKKLKELQQKRKNQNNEKL
jgi:hypothetical protein